MKLVFQPLLHIARTQSCEKVFKAALGNKLRITNCDGRFFHFETNLRLNGNSVLDSR